MTKLKANQLAPKDKRAINVLQPSASFRGFDSHTGLACRPASKAAKPKEPCFSTREVCALFGISASALMQARVVGKFPPPDMWLVKRGMPRPLPYWHKSAVTKALARKAELFPKACCVKQAGSNNGVT